MKVSLSTIKNWFKTGLKPTQQQFWNTFDSFLHKDSEIPQGKVENLTDNLDKKVDKVSGKGLSANDYSDGDKRRVKGVKIEGNRFDYRPNTGNDGSSFQQGDLALNGWISQNEFGKLLSYSGSGDASLFKNWDIIESI